MCSNDEHWYPAWARTLAGYNVMKKYNSGIFTVRLMVSMVNFLLSDRRNRLVLSMAISTCRGLSQKDHGL
jgi:hypothetical protein